MEFKDGVKEYAEKVLEEANKFHSMSVLHMDFKEVSTRLSLEAVVLNALTNAASKLSGTCAKEVLDQYQKTVEKNGFNFR